MNFFKKNFQSKKFLRYFFFFILITSVFLAGWKTGKSNIPNNLKNPFSSFSKKQISKNQHLNFLMEVYEIIKENYWDKLEDEQLINLYVLGTEKLIQKKPANKITNLKSLENFLISTLKEIKDENQKNEFTAQLADIVLANLQPFGRSRLYSQKQEISLKNTIENKTEKNYYEILGVNQSAPPDQLKKVFEKKTEELKKENTEEAKQKLAEVNKAYQTLSDEFNKKNYDEKRIEPTIEGKLLTPDIFYLKLGKFSPTTIEEIIRVTQKIDEGQNPTTLILDLRDNIGGLIDGLPYFLGPFIGNDQYAYQFYHQGNKEDFKTKIGWLPSLFRYKKVVVLINQNTQSSAEVMASVLKKYNVGVLVGTKTKGWGTVERIFEIKNQFNPAEKYSVFLVHRLTLREDGQPIEAMGVEPVINIQNENWQNELFNYFRYPELADTIAKLFNQK